jgi:hypothetical protein
MPTIPTSSSDWTDERLDRLARGMFPIVFGRPAPAPAGARWDAALTLLNRST